MSLFEKLNVDLKTALKSGDAVTSGVIRMITAAVKNKEIEKRSAGNVEALEESELLSIIMNEAKRRRDSISAFESGGRPDLAEKEKSELSIIEKYLPKQMSREEIVSAVTAILGKSNVKNLGEAMKVVMADLRGKADGGLVSEIVKEKFS